MPRVIALIGPTAVGKSAVAVELAQSLGAEIVSCDSMQVYRQMTVLTQAPTHAQRAQVPHRLIDCVDSSEDFSVGRYRAMARPVIEQILARGGTVLLVGGTGLYLKALTEGLCDAPPADVQVRERLWSECADVGSRVLYSRLLGIDAEAASRIHPNDARRIIRALEVYAVTGQPLSRWWAQTNAELRPDQVTVIGLTRDRAELCRRIDERVVRMTYEEAVINEVRALLRQPLSRTVRQVHGLRDLEAYLAGQATLRQTVAIWQQRVRHYARRQLIWFRQTPGIRWVNLPEGERPWESAARLLDLVRHVHGERLEVV